MQAVSNLRNGNTGADQQHFGVLHPDIFDIGTDGDAHFLLKLPGQIIFRVSNLLGKSGELQLLLRMEFNIVPTKPNLGRNFWIGSVFSNPEDEVLKHGKIQGCQIGKRFALSHAVDITVADGIGGIGGDSGLDGFPNAEGCESGGCDDGFLP